MATVIAVAKACALPSSSNCWEAMLKMLELHALSVEQSILRSKRGRRVATARDPGRQDDMQFWVGEMEGKAFVRGNVDI